MTKEENQARCKRIVEIMMAASEGRLKILSEMAMPLKTFLEHVEGIMREMLDNWCLCKWCQMFDPENLNFRHWKGELQGCMKYLMSPKLKNGIGKRKHLRKVLISDYDFNDEAQVVRLISGKFRAEKISASAQLKTVAGVFVKSVDDFIDVLAGEDVSPEEYIDAEFA